MIGLTKASAWWSNLSLARKGITVVLVPLVALLCGFAALYALSLEQRRAQKWVINTLEVRNNLSGTLSAVLSAETSVRGFAITHEEDFANDYVDARRSSTASLSRVATLIRENRRQVRRLAEVHQVLDDRYDLLETIIAKSRNGMSTADREMIALVLGGKSMVDKIRAKLAEMDAEQQQLQTQRLAALDQVRDLSVATGAATATMGLLGGLGATLLFSRSIIRRVRSIGDSADLIPERSALATDFEGEDEITDVHRQLRLTRDLLANRTNALCESEARLQAILDHSTAVVFVKDLEGRFLLVNRHYETLFHMSREEVRGKTVLDLFPAEFAETFRENDLKVLAARKPLQFEERVQQEDGIHTYLSLKFPLLDREGMPYALCGFATDISERKRQEQGLHDANDELERRVRERTAELEQSNERLRAESAEHRATAEALKQTQEQFLQAQKMEALGQLAGGVAHDFNNILTAIMGYGTLMLDELPEDQREESHVAEIVRSSERAAGLSRQLLAFSRRQAYNAEVIDVESLIAGVKRMLRQVIGERLTLETDIDPALGRVKADGGQIEQVLLNLAINARDAMPRGGTIAIVARNVRPQPELISIETSCRDFVAISVRDNGTGIEPDVIGRIFEPFFTTKFAGQGTGLGLATCSAIAQRSGGWMTCRSELGKGTEFCLFLPIVTEDVDHVARPVCDDKLPRGNETVLVVEDEPAVGELLVLLLGNLGYRVMRAEDGEEAEQVVARCNGEIDLVLTDVNMPRVDGRELVHRLFSKKRNLKVLVTSGNDGFDDDDDRKFEVEFLPKPFTMQTLACAVRSILDG
jgi:PAS domain S-box-containing protein